jgi:O-methyltransferase
MDIVDLKVAILKTLQRTGFEVRRVGRTGTRHDRILPFATFAPWNEDRQFRETYERVEASTLVDIYRCYELWSLARDLARLPGDIVEVGVWRGGTGALLAKSAALAGSAARVFLCDTFRGVVKAGPMDTAYRAAGQHADTSEEVVERLLRDVGVEATLLRGVFPEETGARVEGRGLRLVHIDVDVYQSARDVFEWVWPRLLPGAVVVFDDYGFQGTEGVTRYVEEVRVGADRVTLYNLNGHAVMVKTA